MSEFQKTLTAYVTSMLKLLGGNEFEGKIDRDQLPVESKPFTLSVTVGNWKNEGWMTEFNDIFIRQHSLIKERNFKLIIMATGEGIYDISLHVWKDLEK